MKDTKKKAYESGDKIIAQGREWTKESLESYRKYQTDFNRTHYKQFSFRINRETDGLIYERIMNQRNLSEYMKELITSDINNYPNATIAGLRRRKSMRVFTDQDISEESKRLILESAVMAPSAGNQQLYTIIDVQGQDLKDKLAVSCDSQPFIATGKMVLVFCADCKKWYDAYNYAGCNPRLPEAGDFLLAVDDALIAAENAVMAAESLGIGSCYIGDILENYEYHKEILSLPQYVYPAAMLVFGYPTKQQLNRPKPERPSLEHIVHKNGYQEKNKQELKEMLSVHKGDMLYRDWLKDFCNRKYNSDFSKEMSRSVRAMIKDLNSPEKGQSRDGHEPKNEEHSYYFLDSPLPVRFSEVGIPIGAKLEYNRLDGSAITVIVADDTHVRYGSEIWDISEFIAVFFYPEAQQKFIAEFKIDGKSLIEFGKGK